MDLDECVVCKPFLTRVQVSQLLQEQYQLRLTHLKTLSGYDAQNFRVEARPVHSDISAQEGDEGPSTTYILKISNSALSRNLQQIKDATRLMEFLSSKGFSCPRPIPDRHGEVCKLMTFKNLTLSETGDKISINKKEVDTFAVRLLSFLPGVNLEDLSVVPSHIFEEAGEMLGRIHNAWEKLDMDLKAMKEFAQSFLWTIYNAPKMTTFLDVVTDPYHKRICRETLDAFNSEVIPNLDELQHGFLHADFNDGNILVNKPTASDTNNVHIVGFLDFDDSHYGPTIWDIGLTLMYLLQCKTPDRHTAARLYLRGFQKHRRMTQLERSCLYYCAAVRFVQSLLMGLRHNKSSGDTYVLNSQARGWDAFEEMWACGRAECYKKWQFAL